MTRILALDTATSACSVALNVDGEVVEDFAVAPQDHTKRLLPMVDRILARHQLGLRELDAIAFTEGPGSFTGLRICAGMVQGLAFGADLPVVGVSTLETLAVSAQRILRLPSRTPVFPALDARMDEIYWALYEAPQGHGRAGCRIPDRVSASQKLLDCLRKPSTMPQYVVGNASPLVEQLAEQSLDPQILESLDVHYHPDCHPHAQDLARIAALLLESGETRSALEAKPVYVRNEVSWTKRKRIRPPKSS